MHIPAEVTQELVLEGWLERIVRETTVEPLVLPDVGPSASTALSSGPGLQWSYSRWTQPPWRTCMPRTVNDEVVATPSREIR